MPLEHIIKVFEDDSKIETSSKYLTTWIFIENDDSSGKSWFGWKYSVKYGSLKEKAHFKCEEEMNR